MNNPQNPVDAGDIERLATNFHVHFGYIYDQQEKKIKPKEIVEWFFKQTAATQPNKADEVKGAIEIFLQDLQYDPYPEDIFLPISKEELSAIHKMLAREFNMPLDRLSGHIGRILRKPLREKATELLEKEKQAYKQQ